jgi:hypothetical protein
LDDETGVVVVVDVDVAVDVDDAVEEARLPVVRSVVVVAVPRPEAAAERSAAGDEAKKAKAPVSANAAAPREAVSSRTRRRPAASLGDEGWRWFPMPTS